MIREVVFGVGFELILPIFFGLDGVLCSMPVSDVLTFVISASAIAYTYKTLRGSEVDKPDRICYSKTDVLKQMFWKGKRYAA